MEPTKEAGLSDYFASFRRRRWLMIGVGLPIVVAAALLTWVLPTYYRSTAVFRFEAPAVEAQGGGADARNNYLDAYVSKLQDNVLGPASLVQLRDILQLPPDTDGAPSTMQKKIHVDVTTERILDPESARQKDVNSGFTVYYESRSPEKAQQASQWLADQFLNQSRLNRHDRAMQAATFLQAEADKYRASISTLESKLADFKQQHVGELPDSVNVTQAEKERTELDLTNVEQELSALRQNRIFLQSQLQQSQAVNPDNDTLRQLQDEYNRKLATYDANHPDMIALKRQIDTLQRGGGVLGGDSLQAQLETQRAILAQTRQRYSEDHPDVKRLERSIATLEARIASGEKSTQATSAVTNPVVVQLQTQINANDSQTASLVDRRARLNGKLASIAGQQSASPQIEKQYEVMTRDVGLARDKYDELLKRKMDSEVTASGALAGSGDEFRLLQPPGKAVRSNKSKTAIGIVGVLLAGILTLGAALAAEAFDQSVRGSKDLMGILNIVPLAIVPEIRNSRYRTLHKQRLMRAALSALVAVPLLYGVIQLAVG
jgi:polysaccharide biosynthesis transport protein